MRNGLRKLAASAALVTIAALCLAASAQPAPHRPALRAIYRFDGGTPAERSGVRAALRASSFDWRVVPGVVTIHIVPDLGASEAAPGEIWLDTGLLDTGMFAWGVGPARVRAPGRLLLPRRHRACPAPRRAGRRRLVVRRRRRQALRRRGGALRLDARMGVLALQIERGEPGRRRNRVRLDPAGPVPGARRNSVGALPPLTRLVPAAE
jgi:hypothetical protein